MASTINTLRIIVCDDEYLLADHMAQELTDLGATVVAIVGSVAELEALIEGDHTANAAVLDVELVDGEVYRVVPLLEGQGIEVAFCSAYHINDRPAQFAHLGWFDKLEPVENIARALRAAQDARSDNHNL